jgi:hypothetical protein
MPPLMPQGALIPHLMPPRMPIAMRVLATVATVATDMGTLGNPTRCATTGGEARREPKG